MAVTELENNIKDEMNNSVQFTNYDSSYEERKERLTLCTSLPPPSPQIEVYSPVIPIHPGTPVIYTHPPEMTEILLPGTPVQMYTPPVDLQYLSPGPYIYPTPPGPWYPPGIGSQGFIFPTPINQNAPK